MKKLILSILLVTGMSAAEDISYSISGRIGPEYSVKFITHFINHNKHCYISNYYSEEVDVESGDYNITIPLTYVDESNKCVDFKFLNLELKIIPKDVKDQYSRFPILGNYAGSRMEMCLGDNNITMEHMQQLEKEQTAPPVYAGFVKNGREGFSDFTSSSLLPKKYKTDKTFFRLTPITNISCDIKSKGLFSSKGSICKLKEDSEEDVLYHYTGETGVGCHALTHPDFGVDRIENDKLIINVNRENINFSDRFLNMWLK